MATNNEAALIETLSTLVERTAPKENPNYIVNSPCLKRNGEPWSKDLKCRMFFGSIEYNDTPLTKDEVEALNMIEPISTGTIMRNDGSPLKVTVVGKRDSVGRLERLVITPDGQEKNLNLLMPSIEAMALQLAGQATPKADVA